MKSPSTKPCTWDLGVNTAIFCPSNCPHSRCEGIPPDCWTCKSTVCCVFSDVKLLPRQVNFFSPSKYGGRHCVPFGAAKSLSVGNMQCHLGSAVLHCPRICVLLATHLYVDGLAITSFSEEEAVALPRQSTTCSLKRRRNS